MYKKRGVSKEYTGFFARNRLLIAATTLVGTIVGAGILGIPYVVAKSGFLYGFILIVLIGFASMMLNLYTGELVLRTKGKHQLTGYAGKYLGKRGKQLMTFVLIFNVYGALTAYLIGEGHALRAIFGGGSALLYSLIFFVVASFIVVKGIKATGRAELILIGLLLVTVVFIGFFSIDQINLKNLSTLHLSKFFLPYGVILFAFMGAPAIPELQEELIKEKHKLKKAIVIGSVIPIVLYIFFALVVVGIIGVQEFDLLAPNERIATVALSIYSQPLLGLFANFLAVLAMLTSFLALSLALQQMYEYDYGLSKNLALLLTFAVPLVVAFLGLTTFISALGITGTISGGLMGILIILTFWKAQDHPERKPEYKLKGNKFLEILLIVMFCTGILYEVVAHFI